MKYTCEITIDKPINRVIELFDNPDNMKHWMKGLESFEHISGTPGRPGAISKLKFKMGKRDMELIETIITRDLPDEFSGIYETNGVFNQVKNKFVPVSENMTRYITENQFKFKGFMKVIAFIMPGAFKKQSMKYLTSFKDFAEKQN